MATTRWLRVPWLTGARPSAHRPARLRTPRRRRCCRLRLEWLEDRRVLTPTLVLGPSDNIALDQPRVTVELFSDAAGAHSLGPGAMNTFLLDTGANGILAMQSATGELAAAGYATQGEFVEQGVSGDHFLDVSVPYRFDFAGSNGQRNTLAATRILSDATRDFSLLGPWGLVGMPAMVGRVTTLDYTGLGSLDLDGFGMTTSFSAAIPAGAGRRYSFSVDNRIRFDVQDQVVSGDPPTYADVPFFTAVPRQGAVAQAGTFLFDTGAQMSMISTGMAFALGLDANHNGTINDEALRFETISGVGGESSVPVLGVDALHLPTDQGVELAWTGLEVLVLDIPTPAGQPALDGVFGSDLLTSGWFGALFGGGAGYLDQVHLDFRNMALGSGKVYFDVDPSRVATSTTTLVSSANPAQAGQAITLTATVSGGGTPSGTVRFFDGATLLGSATLVGGAATWTTSTLAAGTHSIVASYSGDSAYAPSSSAALGQVVASRAVSLQVQQGAVQRSYVRYVDLTLAGGASAAELVSGGRVRLVRYALDGSGGTAVNVLSALSGSGSQLHFDFGTAGLGGNPNSTAGDGYYEVALDLDQSGAFATKLHFFRLLGDANGDGRVNLFDFGLLRSHFSQTGPGVPGDMNGDGVVNLFDFAALRQGFTRKLADGLSLDG